jgi:hypothetical protein
MDRPGLEVAVVMRRERLDNRWQPWRWVLADVVPDQPGFGSEPRLLVKSDDEERWLHPGLRVELFRDDAEGYWLNLTTPSPAWFVLWRLEGDFARPAFVTLSYHDAGRWLDAQETVEQVPAPLDIIEWLREFTDAHYTPEPRKRRRPQSFRQLEDRFGQPASVTTIKKFGAGDDG